MDFQSDCRAAAITTLDAYAGGASVALNSYRGRPSKISAPQAYVDRVSESIEYIGALMARTVQVEVVILWGLFDSGEATDQRDAFVDGYVNYLRDVPNFASAGTNTTFGVVSTEDDPTFLPDWLDARIRVPYFATRITVEGYAGA